jgi:hypothetical protein
MFDARPNNEYNEEINLFNPLKKAKISGAIRNMN